MIERLTHVVEILAGAFERLRLQYAVGGALANSYWGIVRATQDADLLVNVPALRFQELVDELSLYAFVCRDDAGGELPLSVGRIREQERTLSFFEIFRGDLRVQLFTPCIPLQTEILNRAAPVPFGSRTIRMTTAEDLVLLKMAFHRSKDLLDVRGILRVQRGKLDIPYIQRWSSQMHSDEVQRELERNIQEADSAGD